MARRLSSKSGIEAEKVRSRIETDDDLWYAVRDLAGITIPRVKVCEDHVAPFTAFADAYFARSRNAVWYASRGLGGKSVLLATLAYMEGIELGAAVSLLGGSGEQSQRVHAYMTGIDTNLPNTFWGYYGAPRELLVDDPTKRETRLTNGGRIVVLQASTRSVRGTHQQRSRFDECDEMSWEIFNAATGQAMGSRGIPAQTVMSSTHQYADGTFTKILQMAARKGWPVYRWCYKESAEGWLPESEIEGKRGDVTKMTWDTEYELQEPNPGARAIHPDKVEAMFYRELGDVEGERGIYYEFEEPVGNARYSHGADWARKVDDTVITTFRTDVKPIRLVAFERTQKEPWPVMVAKLDKRIERYNGGEASHDATGLGDVITGYLLSDVEPFIMTGRKRSELLNNYITAIEQGEILSPYIEYMHSEHLYASVDDVYGSGHLPDSISAGALAYRAADRPIDWSQVQELGHVEDFEEKSLWR